MLLATLGTLSIVMFVGFQQQTSSSSTLPTPFFSLAEEYFEDYIKLNPLLATYVGDNRYNDRLAIDNSEQYRREERAMAERYLSKLNGLTMSSLSAEDRISYAMLREELELTVEGSKFPTHLLPISQMNSFPAQFAQMGSGAVIHPFKTVKDYDDFLSRINDFVTWIDVAIANMNEGIRRGVVQPRTIIEASLRQWERLSSTDTAQSIFYQPVRNMPAEFSPSDKARLTSAYRTAIVEKIGPAYGKLHAYLRETYIPKCRTTISRKELPGGEEWYAFLVQYYTTTKLTPDEIFSIGTSEVSRIRKEMEKTLADLGFKGTVQEFIQSLNTNPRVQITNKDSIFQGYAKIRTIVESNISKLFKTIPKADFEIRPVEEFRAQTAPGGQYMAASPDGSRPGVFYVNASWSKYPRQMMEDLFLHEALPGHHFDRSIAQEATSLPRFRRFGYQGAYIEGWGLYAESLGKELGLYTDPYQYFGMLMGDLGRAARLVADVGIHDKGWTKEEATTYLNEHTLGFGIFEIDRYTAMPAQALGYKIGQIKFMQLRAKAQKELGNKFDIREFHNQVLKDGALPLAVLEAQVDRWIEHNK